MGEGGAVFTNSSKFKRAMESIRDWGRDCWCAPGMDNTCGGALACAECHVILDAAAAKRADIREVTCRSSMAMASAYWALISIKVCPLLRLDRLRQVVRVDLLEHVLRGEVGHGRVRLAAGHGVRLRLRLERSTEARGAVGRGEGRPGRDAQPYLRQGGAVGGKR